MAMDMKRVGIYLPLELYEELRKEAFDNYQSMSGLIVRKLGGKKTFIKTVTRLSDEGAQGLMYNTKKANGVNWEERETEDRTILPYDICKHGAKKGLCKKGCK